MIMLDDNNQSDDDNYDGVRQNPATPPSVTGEENPFSGDSTSSESPDIDEELGKVGLRGDENGIKPLDVDDELQEETF